MDSIGDHSSTMAYDACYKLKEQQHNVDCCSYKRYTINFLAS